MAPVPEAADAPVVQVHLVEAEMALRVKPSDDIGIGFSGVQEGVKVVAHVFGQFGNFAATFRRLNGRRTSVKVAIVKVRHRRKRLHRAVSPYLWRWLRIRLGDDMWRDR